MSVRFLGRRVYVAAVVVLACVRTLLLPVAQTAALEPEQRAPKTPASLVPKRTVTRWCRWWRTGLIASALWDDAKGQWASPVCTEQLPLSLLSSFSGTARDKLQATLKWLSPLSTGSDRLGLQMAE
jgi:hypothetical protein